MLHWCITHAEEIETANFLQGAHRTAFLNLQVMAVASIGLYSFTHSQEYDLLEMRAIYAVLPKYFQLDATPGPFPSFLSSF
jgi:hypothetical protein